MCSHQIYDKTDTELLGEGEEEYVWGLDGFVAQIKFKKRNWN